MATTWSNIDSRLDFFLKDTTDTYALADRVAAWNYAQRQLAVQHTPYQRQTALALESDGRSAILPLDFLSVHRVYDADNSRTFKPYQMGQGAYRSSSDELPLYRTFGNVLYFEKELKDEDDITLYYWAYWPEVEVDSVGGTPTVIQDKVLIPPWAELPCQFLTGAVLLQPGAKEAADLRQWNIAVDAGTPLHNSRAQQAREWWWWWETLLSRVTPTDFKGV